jgi:hypothetical protein
MAGLGASSSTARLVDLEASHYVCSDRNMLSNMRKSNVKSMITANHGVVVVKGQGDVQLRVSEHGVRKIVKNCDVLYIHDLMANLLFVGKLADQGMPVTFLRDQRVVGPLEAPFAFAARHDGLFCLNAEPARAGEASDEGCGAVFVTTVACPKRAML